MMEEFFVSVVDAVGDWETMEDVHAVLGGEDWVIVSLWQWLVSLEGMATVGAMDTGGNVVAVKWTGF